MSTPSARGGDRLAALDGLRGVAATIVLVYHVVLASVAVLGTATAAGAQPAGAAWRAVSATPLAIAWAGPELVTVFFVLSAFVLTRAALRAGPAWRAAPYYAGRLLRLYVPVWAAVAFATLLALLVARPAGASAGNLWLEPFGHAVTGAGILESLTLSSPNPAVAIDAALWSLHWEVLFSLAMPLVVLAAPVLARRWWLLAAGAVIVVGAASMPGAVTFLAPFAIGVVLALREDDLLAAAGRRATALLAPAAIVLLTADRWVPGATHDAGRGGALVLVGAALAVLAPLLHAPTAGLLTRRAPQWLGRRSFSLYLIHGPIVVTLAFALDGPSFWVLLPVATTASLIAAALLYRVVERPAQGLARAAAAKVAARRRGRLAPQPV
ncbi:O-acetyltransferase [Baekduia alba]|uniref:acyltransferase family protein n=1 Tax=Baekduia alba TaxID=2997333 RepID=UPI0023413B86|nr:acyltransferase [Baekduia alba]WCB93614.1 O-acetyltransferase [Baekduia alba]